VEIAKCSGCGCVLKAKECDVPALQVHAYEWSCPTCVSKDKSITWTRSEMATVGA